MDYTFCPSDGADAPSYGTSEDAVDNELDGASSVDGATPSGVSRGQNQLHLMPEDWRGGGALITPLFDRLDASTAVAQLVVVTSDAEAAAAIGAALSSAADARGLRVVAATDSRRGVRVLKSTPAQVIVGSPTVLSELLQSAALKLDAVKGVALAWVDDLGAGATRALESLMAELPKDAARLVFARDATAAVEQLVERYARRARRVQSTVSAPLPPVSLSYVTVAESGRLPALRRVLDTLDPESAFIVSRNPDSRDAIASLLRALGYSGDAAAVRVGESPEAGARVVVLFELPGDERQLRALVAGASGARVLVLVTARQVGDLRRLAGGVVAPLSLPEAAQRARSREESLRDELRSVLAAGQIGRELLALEPLLADHDGAEVAAAALRLLETERARPQSPAAASASAAPAMTRLYVNIGEVDGVRAGDLVGAITNEAGIGKSELGRVDVRDRHSTVEVATAVANVVVTKLTGTNIRNRRVLARVDEGPERSARPPRRDGPPGRGGKDRGGPRRREDARKR